MMRSQRATWIGPGLLVGVTVSVVTLLTGPAAAIGPGFGTAPPAADPAPPFALAIANQFVPPTIEVRAGEGVTFVNADPMSGSVGHSLTHQDPNPRFDSGLLRPGTAGEVKGIPSLPPGRYRYFCVVHPPHAGNPGRDDLTQQDHRWAGNLSPCCSPTWSSPRNCRPAWRGRGREAAAAA